MPPPRNAGGQHRVVLPISPPSFLARSRDFGRALFSRRQRQASRCSTAHLSPISTAKPDETTASLLCSHENELSRVSLYWCSLGFRKIATTRCYPALKKQSGRSREHSACFQLSAEGESLVLKTMLHENK